MTELKRCPFCGGEAEIIEHIFGTLEHSYGVECTDCGAKTWQFYSEKTDVIEAWNRRAE